MLPRLHRSLRFFALSACLAAAAASFACSSDSGDDSEPDATTGSGSGGKGGSNGSGNAAGEEGDGSGGEPSSGSGAEGGGDSSSGGSENSSGGRGGSDGSGASGATDNSGGTDSSGGTGGTDSSGGTGGTGTGPDLEAIARGQAIAEDIDVNCSACHGLNYAGSPLYYAGNITPDEATGIGSWSDLEIGTAITEGIGKGGEQLCSTMEPYDFDEGQVRDVIAFLRSLTPVSKTLSGTCED
jgi:mono/diheme cytochrome c family protein